jgi:ferredoxin-NADP reductase
MIYETKIIEIIPRTDDITSYRFPRLAGFTYKPGQFFFVALRQESKELNKHFSFSSSPTQNGYIEFTKRFTDHEYSTALKAAKVGDWARIDGSYGAFTFEGEYPKVALLAGGIGVTPIISICKNATDKHLLSQITVFFGCRTEEDIPFRKELVEMTQANPNLKLHFVVNQPSPSWKGAVGIITADMIKQELPDYKDNVFYCCGPPGMVTAMEKLIAIIGLPKEQLKLEYFTGYKQ